GRRHRQAAPSRDGAAADAPVPSRARGGAGPGVAARHTGPRVPALRRPRRCAGGHAGARVAVSLAAARRRATVFGITARVTVELAPLPADHPRGLEVLRLLFPR